MEVILENKLSINTYDEFIIAVNSLKSEYVYCIIDDELLDILRYRYYNIVQEAICKSVFVLRNTNILEVSVNTEWNELSEFDKEKLIGTDSYLINKLQTTINMRILTPIIYVHKE